jgi:hypothetical protein
MNIPTSLRVRKLRHSDELNLNVWPPQSRWIGRLRVLVLVESVAKRTSCCIFETLNRLSNRVFLALLPTHMVVKTPRWGGRRPGELFV